MEEQQSGGIHKKNLHAYLLLLLLWLVLTVLVCGFVIQRETSKAEMRFNAYAEALREHVHDRLLSTENALDSFAAVLHILAPQEHEKLHAFAERLRERFPSIYSIEFAQRIKREDLPQLESVMQRQHAGFTVKAFDYQGERTWQAAADKPVYRPLLFVHPHRAETVQVLGLDLDSVPHLPAAIEQAYQQQGPVATPPFELAQGGQAYTLVLPLVGRSTIDRSQAATLIALLVVKTDTLLTPHLLSQHAGLYLCLRHATLAEHDPTGELLRIDTARDTPWPPWLLPTFRYERQLPIKGQPFILELKQQMDLYELNLGLLGLILAAGIATFTLLIIYVRALHRSECSRLEAEQQLKQMASFDNLTGLPNRHLLYDRIDHARHRADREAYKLGLLFLDLDDFKTVNDTYGHEGGDQLLLQFALRMQQCLRDDDTIARLGGDEFVVLAEGLKHADDVKAVAEKIAHCLDQPFAIGGTELHLGLSIGTALYPDHGQETEQLLKVADRAMYSHKFGKKR